MNSNTTAYMEYHQWRLGTPKFDAFIPKTPECKIFLSLYFEKLNIVASGNEMWNLSRASKTKATWKP